MSSAAQPTLKQRQWQLREDAILDAAYDLMIERGFADVSMDDVAARAGVSKPTLYQHVASKDELVLRVSLRLMRQTEAALDAAGGEATAIERLRETLHDSLTRRASGLWAARVVVPRALADADPAYCAQRKRVQALLGRLVDEAKHAGDIDPRYPTPVVVRMLSRLFRGDYDDLVADGVVDPEALSAMLVAVTFEGLRPKGSRQQKALALR